MSTTSAVVYAGIWKTVAGSSIHIPSLNSYVYYFPQGHLEQLSNSVANEYVPKTFVSPLILCQVLSVRFLCDSASDQAFVNILLKPLNNRSILGGQIRNYEKDYYKDDLVSFAKTLTPSDANNGGGFSVPRYCAESIFPKLNFEADPPVQNLTMRDTLGNAWDFRHIYRGTPRRHLLTTGWNKFVNGKRLVAGDTVVFMRRKSTNEQFIGLRRASKLDGTTVWDSEGGNEKIESVLKAIENAAKALPFEVVYYPKIGQPDFVVSAEKVEHSLQIGWDRGVRVKMGVETEDPSRVAWFRGLIGAPVPDTAPWFGSPWRKLQVEWDEPNLLLPNMKQVSPWQLELVPILSEVPVEYTPPPKKFKGPTQTDGEEHPGFPMTGLPHYSLPMQGGLGYDNSGFYYPYPYSSSFQPSMQGARLMGPHHHQIPLSNIHNKTFTELLNNDIVVPHFTPTSLNFSRTYPDQFLSFGNHYYQNGFYFSGKVADVQEVNNSTPKAPRKSIQLFGAIITEGSSKNKVISGNGKIDEQFKEINENNQPCASPSQPK